jgi:hypothetical protein
MLRLLLDEHISPAVAGGLRRKHRALSVVCMVEWEDREFLGQSDSACLRQVAAQGLTLVTYDRRTISPLLKIWAEEGRRHGGLIFVDEKTIPPDDVGLLMPIQAQWWSFVQVVIEVDRDDPGVYELGDKNGTVIYIGSSSELRRRLKEHLNEASNTCIRQNTTHYRIEYTAAYKGRERELVQAYVRMHGKPPACNDSTPTGN